MDNFCNQLCDFSEDINRKSQVEIDDCKVSDLDLLNLCGGIPIKTPSDFRMKVDIVASCIYEVTLYCKEFYIARTINFDTMTISNNGMVINGKGNGIGTNLFLNQVLAARDLGFNEINVLATGPGGNYTGHRHWGRVGFSLSDHDTEKFLAWCFGFKFKEKNLFDLLNREDGYKFWTEMGFSWYGAFNLTDDSQNMIWLRQYVEILKGRGAKPIEV